MRRLQYVVITLEGWLYVLLLLILLVGALVRQINLLLVLYGLLTGPLLISWRFVRTTLRDLHIRRRLPSRVEAGQPLVVSLEVTNRQAKHGSWLLVAQDRVTPLGGGPALRPQTTFSYVAPGETSRQAYRGVLNQRGRFRFGPLKISTRFPFGLLRSAFTWEKDDELIVTPRRGTLSTAWRQRLALTQAGAGQGQRRHGTLEGDFYALREWRQADSRRWIHWRTSARRQTLVVRQFEQPRRQDLTLIVDAWLPTSSQVADHDNLELALSFAATVLDDLLRCGPLTLHLQVVGRRPDSLEGQLSAGLLDEALDRLALVEPVNDDPEAVAQSIGFDERRSDTRLVIVTPRGSAWSEQAIASGLIVDTSSPCLSDWYWPPEARPA